MNGRIAQEDTAEERLAAVVKAHILQLQKKHRATGVGPFEADYADLRDALRPYVQRELLLARIEEARHDQGTVLTARVLELAHELDAVQAAIPPEHRL